MRAANGLSLAAAPTFAMMALLTTILQDKRAAMLCSSAEAGWQLGDMTLMYLLMAAFHLAPWLKLIATTESNGPL